jgi:hypothetical protein
MEFDPSESSAFGPNAEVQWIEMSSRKLPFNLDADTFID